MKINIGSEMGLFPTPVTIVGTEVEGKVNWLNICHVGIWGMKNMLLSIDKNHLSIAGIKVNKTLSVNLVSPRFIEKADYVGIKSGNNTDKSQVFAYFCSELKGAPLINESPVNMACKVVETFETKGQYCFIVEVIHTYVDEDCLDSNGKINIEKVNPVLYDGQGKSYFGLGEIIAKCWDVGKNFIQEVNYSE